MDSNVTIHVCLSFEDPFTTNVLYALWSITKFQTWFLYLDSVLDFLALCHSLQLGPAIASL
jgi:hypothetical protein